MNKNQLINEYFYYKAFCNRKLVDVQIELLTKCNLNCKHCYLPEHCQNGLPTDKVKKILKELRALGVVNVTLTGGEIFLRNDIIDLIKYARNMHMRVILLSNGTIITEEQIFQISSLYITRFSTTIFSMNPFIHDFITQKEGSLKDLLIRLETLKKYNIPILIKMPIMKMNYSSINEVEEYCKSNKFEFICSPSIFIKNNGDTSPKEYRLNEEEIGRILEKVNSGSNYLTHNLKMKKDYETVCPSFFYSLFINATGDIYPCPNFPYKLGNIFDNSISDIWFHSKKLKLIQSITKKEAKECDTCKFKDYCERCPGMAMLENNDMYSCDPIAKSIARIRYNDMDK